MQPNTHLGIDSGLVGAITALSEGQASVELATSDRMAADDRGLVHGGFVFGLADYAAMLAVNDPNVVLGSAETRFVKPVEVGDAVKATAEVTTETGRKRKVAVTCKVRGEVVMTGTFTTFVLDHHVLD